MQAPVWLGFGVDAPKAYQRGGHPCVHPYAEPVQEAKVSFLSCIGLVQEEWVGPKNAGQRVA